MTTEKYNLQLAKAIQSITKQQAGFEKSVEKCQELITERFNDIEMKLTAKKKELEELEKQYEQQEKYKKLEVDLEVKEHGYQHALKMLTGRNEVPVNEEEFKHLQESLTTLKLNKEVFESHNE